MPDPRRPSKPARALAAALAGVQVAIIADALLLNGRGITYIRLQCEARLVAWERGRTEPAQTRGLPRAHPAQVTEVMNEARAITREAAHA